MLDRLLLISVGKTPIEKTHESFSAPPTKHDAVTRSKKKKKIEYGQLCLGKAQKQNGRRQDAD